MMKDLALDLMDEDEEPEQLITTPRVKDHKSITRMEMELTTPRVKDHKSISKSQYIPSKTISLTNPEHHY